MFNTKNRLEVSVLGDLSTTERTSNRAATNAEQTKKKEPHIILEIFNDYCTNSTLHGISYIGAKDKSPAEKIWWLIMLILSVIACAFLISKTWTKWKDNPVIINFETEQISIWKIPFPAVTVCPVNKIKHNECNYTKMFRNRKNLSEEDYKLFSDLSLVCSLEEYDNVSFNSTINFTDESAIDSIRKMAPNDTVSIVKWQNLKINESSFAQQLTEEGLCFSFNSFNQDDMFTDQINRNTTYINDGFVNDGWTIEDGYLPELNMSAYPRRTAKDGRISGLRIHMFSFLMELDYVCGLPLSGYKITLHNPAETPKVAEQYFLIPFNRKVSIIVRPELTRTEQNVRSLPAHIRKCYFSNEKSLRFYKVYTQNNCRAECNANITQHYCGCVPFYLPRDNSTRICGYGKINCTREVQKSVLDYEVQENIKSGQYIKNREKLDTTRDIFMNCNCLPSCSSLHYTSEMSQTDMHEVKSYAVSGLWDDKFTPEEIQRLQTLGSLITTQVDIFFKESQFLALQRSELYGQTDFLANCGGLLGLFMGFSLLSLLEIFYFLTIRLWFKYRYKRQNKMY